jgi:transcriptional regulator with XRE-family HTH domain
MKRFGEKMATLRQRHGMSVRDLARELGYTSHSHVGKIESGKREPSLKFAIKVANLFKVTIDQLVNDKLELD